MPISNINNVLNVTSYFLVYYIGEYLGMYWSEIRHNKIDTQAGFK